jgi:hypothetical protein
MVQREIESFMLQDEHWLGPLSQEDFIALEKSWEGIPRDGGCPTGLPELRAALYKKREYARAIKWRWESPYRYWEGWERFTGVGEGLRESLAEGLQGEERDDIDREESWEGLTDEEGSSTGSQDGWGGFPGENEAWEGPREEKGSSTGVGEGLQESLAEGLQGEGNTDREED